MAQPNPEEVIESIHHIMHVYRAAQFQSLRSGPLEVTHMELKVLGFFARHAGATASDLVVKSGRDKAQIARLVSGLRQRGLLDAQADTADRRSMRLALSPAGKAAFESMRQISRQLAERACQGLSGEDAQRILGLMARIEANLADGSKEGGPGSDRLR